MKWFGESWGAPVCVPEDHVATPVGAACLRCEKPVAPDDVGFIMPYVRAIEEPAAMVPMHKDCLMRSVIPDWDVRQSGTRLSPRERSQNAWSDWDDEEILSELAPWPARPKEEGGSE